MTLAAIDHQAGTRFDRGSIINILVRLNHTGSRGICYRRALVATRFPMLEEKQ